MPVDAVREFVDAINNADLDRMGKLMTEDHRLTDSLGTEISGRKAVLQAWKAYFQWMPDYRIDVRSTVSEGRVVALFGVARGTYAQKGELRAVNYWEVHAAFRAVLRLRALESWQVYADNKPVYEILAR